MDRIESSNKRAFGGKLACLTKGMRALICLTWPILTRTTRLPQTRISGVRETECLSTSL
jgi:hypothetical protein